MSRCSKGFINAEDGPLSAVPCIMISVPSFGAVLIGCHSLISSPSSPAGSLLHNLSINRITPHGTDAIGAILQPGVCLGLADGFAVAGYQPETPLVFAITKNDEFAFAHGVAPVLDTLGAGQETSW